MVATEYLLTPYEWVKAKVTYEEERDRRLNDFDQVGDLHLKEKQSVQYIYIR